jgi:hypothetical protein
MATVYKLDQDRTLHVTVRAFVVMPGKFQAKLKTEEMLSIRLPNLNPLRLSLLLLAV